MQRQPSCGRGRKETRAEREKLMCSGAWFPLSLEPTCIAAILSLSLREREAHRAADLALTARPWCSQINTKDEILCGNVCVEMFVWKLNTNNFTEHQRQNKATMWQWWIKAKTKPLHNRVWTQKKAWVLSKPLNNNTPLSWLMLVTTFLYQLKF